MLLSVLVVSLVRGDAAIAETGTVLLAQSNQGEADEATEGATTKQEDTTNLVAEKKPPETNWSAKCDKDSTGQDTDCRVVQSIQLTKTKQTLLSVVVRKPSGNVRPLMTFNLPHGLFLPAGTTLQVDQTPEIVVPIETCDAKGCYASMNVNSEMLVALKRGATMTVTFQNLARKPIGVPVTLVGFTAAFSEIQ